MGEGSPEVLNVTEQDPDVLEAAIVKIAADRTAESESAAKDQAGATEPATPPAESAKPEPTPEPEKAPEAGAGKPPAETEVDLSHLPGWLEETARGKPVEEQRKIDKMWRGMQSTVDKERDGYRQQAKDLRALAEDGAHFRSIAASDNPEARRLAYEALDLVRGKASANGAESEPNTTAFLDDFASYIEMEDDEKVKFTDGLRTMIRAEAGRIAGETVDERVHQPAQTRSAIEVAANEAVKDTGLTEEQSRTAWLSFVKTVGAENVSPENVPVLFGPYVQNAILSARIDALNAATPAPAPESAKPQPAGGSRAATLTGPSSAVPTDYVPEYVREGRAPTSEEGLAEALRKVDVSRSDLAREMREGGLFNS